MALLFTSLWTEIIPFFTFINKENKVGVFAWVGFFLSYVGQRQVMILI